jgi:hypothetical protein
MNKGWEEIAPSVEKGEGAIGLRGGPVVAAWERLDI